MANRGPKKKYDAKLDFAIEQEYHDLIQHIANENGVTKSAVLRKIVYDRLENLSDDKAMDFQIELF